MCVCCAGGEGVSKHVGVGGLEVVDVALQAAVGAVRLLQLLLQLLQTALITVLRLWGAKGRTVGGEERREREWEQKRGGEWRGERRGAKRIGGGGEGGGKGRGGEQRREEEAQSGDGRGGRR